MAKDRKQAALDYHALPAPGKIAVVPTKPCETQQDLSLAYSPGVAEPVPAEVLRAYGLEHLEYGPDYIIPKPLDLRLIKTVPPAVAKAAVDSGVARAGYPAHYPTP